MATPFRLSDGRRDWLASVEGSVVTIDGVAGEFIVTARPDGRWTISHKGAGTPATIAVGVQVPDGIWTGMDGATTQWQVEPASSRVRHRVVDTSSRNQARCRGVPSASSSTPDSDGPGVVSRKLALP